MKVAEAYRRAVACALIALLLLATPLAAQRRAGRPTAPRRRPTAGSATRATRRPAPAQTTPAASRTNAPASTANPSRQQQGAVAGETTAAEVNLSFETFLPAESYALYGELRNVGQQIRSGEMLKMLVMTSSLAGTPPEVRNALDFLHEHAEGLMDARLIFASLSNDSAMPHVLFAIEFPSIEAAQKFTPEFSEFVASVAPPEVEVVTETGDGKSSTRRKEPAPEKKKKEARAQQQQARLEADALPERAPQPFFLRRAGRFIFASDTRLDLKKLASNQVNPSKLLFNQPSFKTARSRFASDAFFIYFDFGVMQRSFKRMEEEIANSQRQRQAATAEGDTAAADIELVPPVMMEPQPSPAMSEDFSVVETERGASVPAEKQAAGETRADEDDSSPETDDEAAMSAEQARLQRALKAGASEDEVTASVALPSLFGGIILGMSGRGMWGDWQMPEAISLAATFEGDELAARLLLLNREGAAQMSVIPFLPMLIPGAAMTPEAASYVPAETDIFLTTSLDPVKIYDRFIEQMKRQYEAQLAANEAQARIQQRRLAADASKNAPVAPVPTPAAPPAAAATEDREPPLLKQLALLEKLLNLNVREDIISSLGNELAVCLPGSYFNPPPPPPPMPLPSNDKASPGATPSPSPEPAAKTETLRLESPVILISLKNRQAVEALLPRLLPLIQLSMGSSPTTVKSGDTQITALGGGAFAFIGDMLALSPDITSLRYVAEAHKEGRTLSSVEAFRRATSWQPRQALGQAYISNDFLKGILAGERKDAEKFADAEARSFLAQFNLEPGAVTHAVTNEGDGALHEVRVSGNLITLFMAYRNVQSRYALVASGELQAIAALQSLRNAEMAYREANGKGKFGTLAELQAAHLFEGFSFEQEAYRFDLNVEGDKFEATATPLFYPERGRRSFFINETGVLRGGDKAGARASAADPTID